MIARFSDGTSTYFKWLACGGFNVAWSILLIDSWFACLIACLINCMLDSLLACLIACLREWLIAYVLAFLIDCVLDGAHAWLIDCLRACFLNCLLAWLSACLIDWLLDSFMHVFINDHKNYTNLFINDHKNYAIWRKTHHRWQRYEDGLPGLSRPLRQDDTHKSRSVPGLKWRSKSFIFTYIYI